MNPAFFQHDGPLLFAHRGGAAHWPENTLHAFRNAITLGYRYIETDVRRTHDGRLVLFHDATVERTCDGNGLVADHTLAQLKALNAGFHFEQRGAFPFREDKLTVPTVEEALALDARYTLEIKETDEATARQLWEIIDHHGVHDRVLVASGHDVAVRYFRKHAGEHVVTSAGRQEIFAFWLKARLGLNGWGAVPFQALQVPIHQHHLRVVTPGFIRAAGRRGVQVHVWTINDAETMRELLQMGAHGVMTDEPQMLLEVARACSPSAGVPAPE